MILFKNTLNRNQCGVKFDVQTSSILGIEGLIDSADYKSYFKAPLSPSNIGGEVGGSVRVVSLGENVSPVRREYGAGVGRNMENYENVLRPFSSAFELLEGQIRGVGKISGEVQKLDTESKLNSSLKIIDEKLSIQE